MVANIIKYSKEQAEFLELVKVLKADKKRKIPYTDIENVIGKKTSFISSLRKKGYGTVTSEMINTLKQAYPNELLTEEERAAQVSDSEKELKVKLYDLNEANKKLEAEVEALNEQLRERDRLLSERNKRIRELTQKKQ